MDRNEQTLSILLEEYKVLKAEQGMRIGFRDNLLYVTLGLFGAIASFAITSNNGYYAFLVIPWICLVMGWTYIVNDEKISAIGRYIRQNLNERISSLIGGAADEKHLFAWEIAHRDDQHRKRRKRFQLLIDLTAFVFSGLTAIIVFWILAAQAHVLFVVISVVEFLLLLVLGFEISAYADLSKEEREV